MPPSAAQTPGKNHRPRKKPRRSDPTSSPPSLSDGRLPQKAFQAQSLSRAKTPYPGLVNEGSAAYGWWSKQERRDALFAHLHVNKDTASEMYRLPIQPGGNIPFT